MRFRGGGGGGGGGGDFSLLKVGGCVCKRCFYLSTNMTGNIYII